MSADAAALTELYRRRAVPPDDLVFQLPKSGRQFDYVGHADVTRALIEEDPTWTWEPAAYGADGAPAIVERGKHLSMWGRMTVHGKTLPCVGQVDAAELTRGEVDKLLISDLIKNGAMRFGVFITLWSKAELHEFEATPLLNGAPVSAPAPEPTPEWDEPRWRALAERLKVLPEAVKAQACAMFDRDGLFEGRKPKPPFPDQSLDFIEKIITAAEGALADAPTDPAGPTPAAIEVMMQAKRLDDPTSVEFPAWQWALAEVEDLDAFRWESITGKDKSGKRRTDIVKLAGEVAAELGQPAPDRIDDIHGDVARELRIAILTDADDDPF